MKKLSKKDWKNNQYVQEYFVKNEFQDFCNLARDKDISGEETALITKIHEEYHIPVKNLMQMVLYVNSRIGFGTDSYNTRTHTSTQNDLFNFLKSRKKIKSIAFKISGGKELIKIENKELIEELTTYIYRYYGFNPFPEYNQTDLKDKVIDESFPMRWCATCLYNELMNNYKKGPAQSCYIIGEIFALKSISLKKDLPIFDEIDFKKHYPHSKSWKNHLHKRILEFIVIC
jgi:hypothetical protein